MEQKKILWVILSVVVFVVVVLGAGLIWFRPADLPTADGSAETPASAGTGFDAIEYIREGDGFPGLEEAGEEGSEEDFIAVSGEIVYGEDPESSGDKAVEPEVDHELPGESSSNGRTAAPRPAPAAAVPAPVQRQPAAPRAETVKKPVRVVEYWIQAGSFQSTSRAEDVKEMLGDKGFSAVISTKDVGGTTWFRVRVGPYSSKGEADKFLEWVKDIDGFSDSYVSEVTVLR